MIENATSICTLENECEQQIGIFGGLKEYEPPQIAALYVEFRVCRSRTDWSNEPTIEELKYHLKDGLGVEIGNANLCLFEEVEIESVLKSGQCVFVHSVHIAQKALHGETLTIICEMNPYARLPYPNEHNVTMFQLYEAKELKDALCQCINKSSSLRELEQLVPLSDATVLTYEFE